MGTVQWIIAGVVGAVLLVLFVWWLYNQIENYKIAKIAEAYFGEIEASVRVANQYRPPNAQIKSLDDISHADLPNVIRGLLLERGVDIALPLDEVGQKHRKEVEDKVNHWLRYGADNQRRANYDRVVARAETILADEEGKYTESQKAAADRILHMPIPNLAAVTAYEMDKFFELAETFGVPPPAAGGA